MVTFFLNNKKNFSSNPQLVLMRDKYVLMVRVQGRGSVSCSFKNKYVEDDL